MLMGEREIDNSLPGEKAAGQKVTERKSYSEVVVQGVRKRARMFMVIVRQDPHPITDPILIVRQELSLFTNRCDAIRYEVTDTRGSRLHELWRYRRA